MAELFDSLAGRPVLRTTFVQHLIAFCSRPEVTCDVMFDRSVEPVVPKNCLKFGEPGLNLSREILPEASEAAFLTVFSQ